MKKKRGGLKKRHNQPTRTTGGRYPTVFNKKKIPVGINFFSCKEGSHIVDILPFEVGPDMPFDDQNKPVTAEGDFDYVLDLWVHQNVGKMQQPFVCPYENFGLPCPICEYIKANRLPKPEWSKTRAKRRSIYLIWDRTSSEMEKKGVQIFDAAHFFMEEKILEIATLPRGGGFEVFSHPDTGKSVCWSRKGAGAENTNYLGHRFIDRESPIPDKILDMTFPLDGVINMHPTYDEIKKEAIFPDAAPDEGGDAPFEEDKTDIPDDNVKVPETEKTGADSPKPKLKRRVFIKKK
jgi:hypothetical protein